MSQNYKISVIVCIYKVEQYLRQCLDSIVNQTYTNLEIILVDDGSPDNCPQICDQYADQDSRIRVIHKSNGGLSDAKNTGLAAATGDLIIYVDGDDYISLDMYTIMVRNLEQTQSDMVICDFYRMMPDGNIPEHNQIDKAGIFSRSEAMRLALIEKISNYSWNKLCKATLYKKVEFPIGQNFEDAHQIMNLFSACESVSCIDDCLYYYRTNQQGISLSGYPRGSFDLYLAYQKKLEYAKIKYPELVDLLVEQVFRTGLDSYNKLNNVLLELKQDEADELFQYLWQHRKLALHSPYAPLKRKIALWFFSFNPQIYHGYYRWSRIMYQIRMGEKDK